MASLLSWTSRYFFFFYRFNVALATSHKRHPWGKNFFCTLFESILNFEVDKIVDREKDLDMFVHYSNIGPYQWNWGLTACDSAPETQEPSEFEEQQETATVKFWASLSDWIRDSGTRRNRFSFYSSQTRFENGFDFLFDWEEYIVECDVYR
jgi:hypothetical protein